MAQSFEDLTKLVIADTKGEYDNAIIQAGRQESLGGPIKTQQHARDKGAMPRVTAEIDLSHLAHFQLLPGEIRQKIYKYLWSDQRVMIGRTKTIHQIDGPENHRLARNYLWFRDRTTHTIIPLKDEDEIPESPMGLILSCRSIHTDVIHWLYATTQFVFYSVKAARRFLKLISPEVKASICHIEIFYAVYNDPQPVNDRTWKDRSDASWMALWRRLSDELPSLKVFYVDLTLYHRTVLNMQPGDPLSDLYSDLCDFTCFPQLEWLGMMLRAKIPTDLPYMMMPTFHALSTGILKGMREDLSVRFCQTRNKGRNTEVLIEFDPLYHIF
ncbi:hypothetical protein N7462_006279 [Penicillium macrosclerotiorum]|uniref:uncharacterized protein n=1 Tax=Penicillium macrosclerotiorum TaxID=303699 RepID=UPI0025466A42|nr:uncharacterized protein N7462_006279 [Penicillium macrosclerotiorum]KAJ5683114.1 hypothetical protein N7462_006279 [Penicillium macrosclerotiorum]